MIAHRRWIAAPLAALVLVVLVIGLAACSNDDDNGDTPDAPADDAGGMQVNDAWVRATVPQMADDGSGELAGDDAMDSDMAMASGQTTGAFMTLANHSDTDERLIAASVPANVATTVEIHETTLDENDVMRMRPVDGVIVPADGNLVLKPGAFHIMLLDVQQDLNAGDTVPLTLTFESGLTLDVMADVRPLE